MSLMACEAVGNVLVLYMLHSMGPSWHPKTVCTSKTSCLGCLLCCDQPLLLMALAHSLIACEAVVI